MDSFALRLDLWQFRRSFRPQFSIVDDDALPIFHISHNRLQRSSAGNGFTPMIMSLLVPLFFVHFAVTATVETEPSPYPGDSLDDIAIWVNQENPGASLILATLKASNVRPVLPTGILVYDLAGRQLQFLKGGTPNNIDLRENFEINGQSQTLIAASHWYSGKVGLYLIDKTSLEIALIGDLLPTKLDKVRGLCMYHDQQNDLFYYFVNSESGQIQQYLIGSSPSKVTLVRSFSLQSAIEGCVVDDQSNTLYVAEESFGIWRFQANPNLPLTKTLVDKIRWFGPLKPDIEGLTLVHETATRGYLIASSQGRNKYLVYDKSSGKFLRSFSINGSQNIDKVTGSDGIAGIKTALGGRFPNGVFIAHDHRNTLGGKPLNQNFKLVPWEKISRNLNQTRREN